jgi:hypothetical protein
MTAFSRMFRDQRRPRSITSSRSLIAESRKRLLNPAPLFARDDEPLARLMEVDSEHDAANRDGRVAREVLDEAPVGGREFVGGVARFDQQAPNRLAVCDWR